MTELRAQVTQRALQLDVHRGKACEQTYRKSTGWLNVYSAGTRSLGEEMTILMQMIG